MVYSSSGANFVLGCILNNTNLLTCGRYKFKKKCGDFVEQFHKVIFVAIQKLAEQGVVRVEPQDVYEIIKNNKTALTIFETNDGLKFVSTIKKLSNDDSFEYYYAELRKHTMIREAKKITINNIYDESIDNQDKLDKLSTKDIINKLNEQILELKREFSQENDNTTRKQAGVDSKKTFEKFKDKDFFGANFHSSYLTSLWGSFRKGQVYMRSGDTSSGKSRRICGDLSNIGMKRLYDINTNKWYDNPQYVNEPILYLGSEMELGEEVEPIFVAHITKINSAKITEGDTTEFEDKLIDETLDIIKDSNLFLVDMPEFNMNKLEEEIKYYKTKYNVGYVGFDYVALTNQLVSEFTKERGQGVGTRGDEVLLAFVERLKQLAKKYDVGILTASQTNAGIKDYMKRDYEVLRGGKSMADKLTGGSICMPITPQELSLVQAHILEYNKNTNLKGFVEPNYVETIYKSRFGKYPKECKIFSKYDLGTMTNIDMFVTNKNFEKIKVNPIIISNFINDNGCDKN